MKETQVNYRPAEQGAYSRCFNCRERQSVPVRWCDHAGRQVKLDDTCDEFKGVHQ